MTGTDLGRVYKDGEVVVREGEPGDCMYVVQSGRLEVLVTRAGGEQMRLRVMEAGDIFGEMALFNKEKRSATVRALGEAHVLTIDKKAFLRRVHEDPSIAFMILEKMSLRIRDLSRELAAHSEVASPR